MDIRKYVIARVEKDSDKDYVKGFMAPSDRARGWAEGGLEDIFHEPRIRKTYTTNYFEATHFSHDDGSFICAAFNMVFRNNAQYSFALRHIDFITSE